MNHLIKKSLINNKILKLISLFLGLATWALLSHYHTSSTWLEVPIYFYNIPTGLNIVASQEKITIKIHGKLADIKQCQDMGLHIDASDFKPGQQRIQPCQEQLFLPKSVRLVQSKPLFFEISTTVA